jgi:hypothetical protein
MHAPRRIGPEDPALHPLRIRDTISSGVRLFAPSPTVPTALSTPPDLIQACRRVFWRTYQDWLATADDVDIEQLERALQPHAQHVRPVTRAISDAMRDPSACAEIPLSLRAALVRVGWQMEP